MLKLYLFFVEKFKFIEFYNPDIISTYPKSLINVAKNRPHFGSHFPQPGEFKRSDENGIKVSLLPEETRPLENHIIRNRVGF